MTNIYDSRDRDELDVPSFDCKWSFSVTPKHPSSSRFTLLIIASIESKDALVEFFKVQQEKAAKDRCCVTATHDHDGTSLELTVIDHQVNACAEGRRFELIATMESHNLRKNASIVQRHPKII